MPVTHRGLHLPSPVFLLTALLLLAAPLPRPARAKPVPPPIVTGAWLGLVQSEADPALFGVLGMEVTGQDHRRFTGRFRPIPPPIRLVLGERPSPPPILPFANPIPPPILPFDGTVAASGQWNAVARGCGASPHAVLHGELSSFLDGLLFSDAEVRFQGRGAGRVSLRLLQSFARPTPPPIVPSLVGDHEGQVLLPGGSVDAGESVPLRLRVGTLGQAGTQFVAAGLYGDVPFLLAGTLVPPNPIAPTDPCRALLLGPGLRGELFGSYTADHDTLTGISGQLQVRRADGVVQVGSLSLAPSPPPILD